MKRREQRTVPAFTLIELLIVVAILSALAAILFPVFARAKEHAYEASNISNLRQLGSGMLLYSGDNDEWIPTWNEVAYEGTAGLQKSKLTSDAYWDAKVVIYTGLKDQLGPAFDQVPRPGVWHSPRAEESSIRRSYGLNQMLVFSWTAGPNDQFDVDVYKWRYFPLTSVDSPSSVLMLGDGGREGVLSPPRNWDGWSDEYVTQLGYYRREAPWRYDGRSGYVYADGHAKMLLGNVVYPSPILKLSNSTVLGEDHCEMAASFAPTATESAWHKQIALQLYGVQCR